MTGTKVKINYNVAQVRGSKGEGGRGGWSSVKH